MDLRSEHSLWLLQHGLMTVVPPLSGDLTCEVLVVGGGITGALVAYRLQEAGIDCAVIDRRDLGQGSTSASTALLQYDIDVPLAELCEQIGIDRAQRAYRAGVEAIDALEAVARQVGETTFERRPSLYFARHACDLDFLKTECSARTQAGLEVRWLEAGALRDGWGLVAAGAIHSTVAAQVDPYRFTHRLLGHVMGQGVPVHDRTEVQDLEESASGVEVTTDRGVIRARWVVMATGYESVQWLAKKVVRLESTFALASEPVPRDHIWPDRALLWEYAEAYLYARWTADDRLLLGGGDESFRNPAKRDRLIARKTQALMNDAAEMLPDLPLEPAFAWAGTFGTTQDGLGYIGAPPDRQRVLFALGFGGNGITYSEIASRVITETVRGHAHPDAPLFAFGRSR